MNYSKLMFAASAVVSNAWAAAWLFEKDGKWDYTRQTFEGSADFSQGVLQIKLDNKFQDYDSNHSKIEIQFPWAPKMADSPEFSAKTNV